MIGLGQWTIGNLGGLIPIVGGIYGLLLARGILPKNPADPERAAHWRRKCGPMMMWLCPVIILGGIAQVAGILG